METEHIANHLLSILSFAMQSQPLVFLQSGALVGVISIILFMRKSTYASIGKSYELGICMGVAGFLLNFLVLQLLRDRVQDPLMTDFIFLAGFLGGWRNVLPVTIMVFAARVFLGGGLSIFFVLDVVLIACGSLAVRNWFNRSNTFTFSFKGCVQVLLLRFLVVVFSAGFTYALFPSFRDVALGLIVRRTIGSFSFSLLTFFAVGIMVRRAQAWDAQMYTHLATGLPNRKALHVDFLESYAKNQEQRGTLLLIELCNFMQLVQERGHDWADDFSCQMKEKLQALMQLPWFAGQSPQLYCFSDRSFAVYLRDIEQVEVEESSLADKLYNELVVNQPAPNRPDALYLWFNIGVFEVLPIHRKQPKRFLRTLTALECSERTGVQYFDAGLSAKIRENAQIRHSIEEWILHGNVPLWLQPKVILRNAHCIGAEALLRAGSKNGGTTYISPPKVFSIAKVYRMLDELEWAVIVTAVGYLEEMPPELHSLRLSINLSPSSLERPGLCRDLCQLLKEKGIAPKRLTIEIIETNRLSEKNEVVSDNITHLVQAGIGLSLDDFGTGYSSLSLLTHLPFTEIKLDHSMVSSMSEARGFTTISMVAEGAKRYNAVVVAEGVETPVQREQLQEIGISIGQGYLFGKAMPLEEFLTYAKLCRRREEWEPQRPQEVVNSFVPS